ncbi:protein of unknown function [Acidithiobacillus ferrivorans]|uniref:Secreted protein n=1 Tax=Acidithiobacillus ferrivorans TaxID=160808 RepID=A0ABY1MRB6_9PROT|nr:protein of unknown function [Acidithiobacillus ferrivorans]
MWRKGVGPRLPAWMPAASAKPVLALLFVVDQQHRGPRPQRPKPVYLTAYQSLITLSRHSSARMGQSATAKE